MLLFPPFLFSPLTAEDYTGKSFVVRERASSRFVFRLWRSKDRSSLLSVRELRRPRLKSCAFPRNWTGSIFERASPAVILEAAALVTICMYIHVYVHIHIHINKRPASGGPPTEIERSFSLRIYDVRSLGMYRGLEPNFLLSFIVHHVCS